jgi:N-acetylglucosamine-6-phosphate deacetylase
MTLTLIQNAQPWQSGAPTWALHDGTRIRASGTGAPDSHLLESDARGGPGVVVHDAHGQVLVPAFVDAHCHGGGGSAFEDPGADETILGVHGLHGTGVLTASLVANPLESIRASVERLRAAKASAGGASIGGIHLEGPCLSPSHKGAHAERFLTRPTVRALEPILEAGEGFIRQVTIAPELDDDLAATRFLVNSGVAVAVGHTDADYATTRAAFDAGASILTHTFNAMHGLHHRAPGPVAAALDASHVWMEIIADGVHVHEPMVRMLCRLVPERLVLVTDAMSATGCGDGHYKLGELDVDVRGGTARLADGSSIAGSTLTMDRAVEFVRACGMPREDAIRAATVNPTLALGYGHGAGSLKPGAPRPWLVPA